MYKKIINILAIIFFVTSCQTMNSAKRALTGDKSVLSSDEFLVKKKDPLILPPDYENLPIPNEEAVTEEISTFEKNLGTLIEDNSSRSSSVEDSILKKIRSK